MGLKSPTLAAIDDTVASETQKMWRHSCKKFFKKIMAGAQKYVFGNFYPLYQNKISNKW